MSEDKSSTVTKRGPWTCVEKVKSGNKSFYVNVVCRSEPPRNAVELAGGLCARPRCTQKPIGFRQLRFKNGSRGYEFSCAKHFTPSSVTKSK